VLAYGLLSDDHRRHKIGVRGSGVTSLQRKAAGDSSWHLWGAKSNYQTTYYASSYYEQNEPNPSSPAQFLFYGPNNPPAGDC
jgi:hypothetical protein